MSLFGDGAKQVLEKALELMKEINQMSVRIEANDRETHRMLEEFKRLIDKYEARQQAFEQQMTKEQQDLVRRLDKLEASFGAAYQQALMVSAKEGAKEAVKETLAKRADNDEGYAENLARAATMLSLPGKPADRSGD